MRLLTRYVLREVCQVFLVTLLALTMLFVLIFAVQVALAQGLGIAQVVLLLPYLLPNALMFAVPGTILFAVSSVYGRMSGANEVVAIKSLGISPMAILWPALSLAVLLSFATVWLNDLAMSWGTPGVHRVVVDALEDIAYRTLRSRRSFSTSAFSVSVKKVEGRTLVSPIFSLADDTGLATIRAETAELRSNPGSGVLTLKLYNAAIDKGGHRIEYPGVLEREVAIPGAGGERSPAQLALREIPAAASRQRENIERVEQQMVAQAGFQMMSGDFDGLRSNDWNDGARNLQFQKSRLYRMQTEPPRRWANGFSCLCFAMVGAVMAIRMRNSDALTSFFLCFGPILLAYYPLLLWGLDRAKSGAINPYLVWSANALLIVWGLWLLRRVVRY